VLLLDEAGGQAGAKRWAATAEFGQTMPPSASPERSHLHPLAKSEQTTTGYAF
jgi:hypothetical protein